MGCAYSKRNTDVIAGNTSIVPDHTPSPAHFQTSHNLIPISQATTSSSSGAVSLFAVLHGSSSKASTTSVTSGGSLSNATLNPTLSPNASFELEDKQHHEDRTFSIEPIKHVSLENGTPVRINQYRITQTLGKGAFATVKLAVHLETNDAFAMKIPRKPRKHVFRQEISIFQQCGFHPNIVMLHSVLHREETAESFLVMEYMPGGALGSMDSISGKANVKPIKMDDVPRIRQQYYDILQGLAHLHRQNIVHRDIKPENILIGDGGVCKLSDFGLSKVMLPDQRCNSISGTQYFLPPEAWLERNHSGYASDMWALGVTMYTSVFQCLP
eukprot:PhF_6_TR6177/c0_g2_i3/m.9255/K07359/CAMKK2; calcium/calmodulin-dependent protein kinase kinase 2